MRFLLRKALCCTKLILDLVKVDMMKFNFELGTPFTPFQQLMGVLPEDSKEHVPSAYRVCLLVIDRWLMVGFDD